MFVHFLLLFLPPASQTLSPPPAHTGTDTRTPLFSFKSLHVLLFYSNDGEGKQDYLAKIYGKKIPEKKEEVFQQEPTFQH